MTGHNRDFESTSLAGTFYTLLERYLNGTSTSGTARRALFAILSSLHPKGELDDAASNRLNDYLDGALASCRSGGETSPTVVADLIAIADAAYLGQSRIADMIEDWQMGLDRSRLQPSPGVDGTGDPAGYP